MQQDKSTEKRVAVVGGSFDPPGLHHMIVV